MVDDGGSVHDLDNGLKAKLIIDNEINIKQLGAYGDGQHDDTDIFNLLNIIKYSKIYLPKGIYNISNVFSLSNIDNLHIEGNEAIIKSIGTQRITNIIITMCNNMIIDNITINGNNLVYRGLELQKCNNYTIRNSSFLNVGNDNINGAVSGLFLRTCHNGYLEKNVVNYVHSSTVAAGIDLEPAANENISCHNTVINSCSVIDISPVDDGDGVKILNGFDDADCNLTVQNCYFENCRKRALKFQAKGCHSINNKMIFSNSSPFAAIDFQRGYGESINDYIIYDYDAEAAGKTPVTAFGYMIYGIDTGYIKIEGCNAINTHNTDYYKNNSTASSCIRVAKLSDINAYGDIIILNSNFNDTNGNFMYFANADIPIKKLVIDNVDCTIWGRNLFAVSSSLPNIENININNFTWTPRSGWTLPVPSDWTITKGTIELLDWHKSGHAWALKKIRDNSPQVSLIIRDSSVPNGYCNIINNKAIWYDSGTNNPASFTATAKRGYLDSAREGDLWLWNKIKDNIKGYYCIQSSDNENLVGIWTPIYVDNLSI